MKIANRLRATFYASATALMFLSASVGAQTIDDNYNYAGLWYSPDRDGTGIWISPDMGAGHAVLWYLNRRDGSSAYLHAGENCTDFPCVVPLHEPTVSWLGGDVDLGEPIGSLEIQSSDTGLRVTYDIRGFDPDNCFGISPGGTLFRECAGTRNLVRLTN